MWLNVEPDTFLHTCITFERFVETDKFVVVSMQISICLAMLKILTRMPLNLTSIHVLLSEMPRC